MTAHCDDCGHTESLHLGGYCSGRPAVDDDPLDEARCGCDDFREYEDDDWDDDPCACDDCEHDQVLDEDLGAVAFRPMVTLQPAARYL